MRETGNGGEHPMDSIGEIRWRIPIHEVPIVTYRRSHQILMQGLSRRSRGRILKSLLLGYGAVVVPILAVLGLFNPHALLIVGSKRFGDTYILDSGDLLVALWALFAVTLIMLRQLTTMTQGHLLTTLYEALSHQGTQTLTIGEEGALFEARNHRQSMPWGDALDLIEKNGDWFLQMSVSLVIAVPSKALSAVPDRDLLRDFVRARIASAADKDAKAIA